MARPASLMKQTRTRHSQAYKDEALALAERIGVSKAAEQLGLHASQLYGWRSKTQQTRTSSEREQALKVECIHGERFTSRAQMRETVFEYVETDYNRQRRHSTLGHISPEAFEARMSA